MTSRRCAFSFEAARESCPAFLIKQRAHRRRSPGQPGAPPLLWAYRTPGCCGYREAAQIAQILTRHGLPLPELEDNASSSDHG